MTKYRVVGGWVALAALMAYAAACGDRGAQSKAAADSDLTRDLALASQQPAAQPTFQDTAVAPTPKPAPAKETAPVPQPRARAPRRPEPRAEVPRPVSPPPSTQAPVVQPTPVAQAPAPAPAAAPARGEIGVGTGFGLTSGAKVCTNTNRPGDKIVATLNSAVTGSNGAVIPAGSTIVLEVASTNAGQNGDGAQINFRIRSLVINDKTYDVSGDVSTVSPLEKTKIANADPNAEKKKVIGGAIAGAILGQMIGHNTKGTIIGAAAGAATGAAVSRSGESYEGCLPAGSSLHITLNSPILM
jgi:outer membrane biosynthesis protein TonB